MTLIEKTLWHINSHSAGDLTLEGIAKAVGVSRHHLAHAFGEATGHSVIGYVRALRLGQAARDLAKGAPDILSVALAAGYGSHEAFTRAFRDRFGLTPEQLRDTRNLETLNLVEPLKMSSPSPVTLQPPRYETGQPMNIAGLKATYRFEAMGGLPAQWEKFVPHLGHVPGQVGRVAYGVVLNGTDAGFDYVCGVEVKDFDRLNGDLDKVRIPAQRYAVFAQSDHVSKVRGVCNAIWGEWLPASGHEVAEGPLLERYGETFNGETGEGGFEIWLPLKR